MRIVSGLARGRRLEAPPGRSTRPTGDRVREAIFNALWSLDSLEGAVVLDLFAGSGALGIEALSRGASHVTFVESDRAAASVIRSNLAATGLADRATVVNGTVVRHLEGMRELGEVVDLAFADPPYVFDDWSALLRGLPAGLAVLESDRPVEPPEGWAEVRRKRYSGTFVTITRRTARDPDPDQWQPERM